MSRTLTDQDIKSISKEVLSGVEKLLKNIHKMEAIDTGELMNVEELCNKLRLKKSTVYAMLKNNEIKSVRIGRQIYVKNTDLNDYINQKFV
jgi:excisionase family DNA binding protein